VTHAWWNTKNAQKKDQEVDTLKFNLSACVPY